MSFTVLFSQTKPIRLGEDMFSLLDGKYIVSSNGVIRNTHTGRALKPIQGVVTLYGEDKLCLRLNRLIAILYLDNHNNYQFVAHKNGNKKDCSVGNLAWTKNLYRSDSCLVFFDSTGMPAMFKSYDDFANAVGSASNRDISKLIKGELDSIGDYFSAAYIERQIKDTFTEQDILKSKEIH